jgi:peptide/nickel transport system substrate-binding protein
LGKVSPGGHMITVRTHLIDLAAALTALLLLPAAALASASPTPSPYSSPAADASASAGSSAPLVYRIGLQSDVDNMNPFSTYNTIPWECFRVGYNFLTWYDADYKPAPDLADPVPTVENGGVTDGGRVWTFHIRPNVKWSDGVPLTARDVAYTYNRILGQKLSMYLSYFTGVTKVEAPDDQTVVITSKRPNAVMTALYVPILPEHIWSKVPDSKVESYANVPMVSSGPFRVTEVKIGKYVKMERNPHYQDGFGVEPTVDEVLFAIYQTQDSLVADYKAGNLDAAIELEPGFYRSLKGVPGSTSVAAPGLGFHELGCNCWNSPKSKGNPLLRDVRIRQAMNWAIDKQAIAAIAMDGLAPAGTSLLSPVDTFFHWNVPPAEQYSYDPAKAKQILDDAGYKMGPNGVRVAPNGKPLKFRLAALNEYPMDITAAKKISAYLKDVGIGITLQVMDENAFTNANYDNADDDLYIWSWTADIDPGYILSVFTTDQILNSSDSEYSDPIYNKLYTAQAQAVIPAERKRTIDQMQQILYRDSPYSILWYNVLIQAFRTDKWTGYSHVPRGNDGAAFRNMLRTTYIDLKPVATATTTSAGSSTGAIVAIVLAALVVIAIVVFVVMRRRPKRVETE